MLEGNGDKDEIPPSVTSRIREILARNIAVRNHGLSPQRFNEAVTILLSSLVAARLLEEAGTFHHGSVEVQTQEKGLIEGLSSLFSDNNADEVSIPPGLKRTTVRTWPDISACKTLSIDPHVTRKLVSLTFEKKFYDEWTDAWSDSHEHCLSHEGRMVIEEQSSHHPGPGGPLLPAGLIQNLASDLVLPRLKEKTPKTAELRLIDPACRTGRILLAMYHVIEGWHLSWYYKHLIPLLEEGRDPASRKVQELLPVVTPPETWSGYPLFGTAPLPVYQLPDGRWDLTWDEKVRILGDSLYGIDADPAAIEVTRLSILSCFLNNMGQYRSGPASTGTLRVILMQNFRCGNILIGKDYEKQPSLLPETLSVCHVRGFCIGDEFPGVISEGGFGVVFSVFPSLLPYSGCDLKDYLCRHYHAGKPDDATPCYLESGISLARPGGMLCGIVTGTWLRSRDAARFRGWLAGYQVENIISLKNHPAFAGVCDPLLITITNHPGQHPARVMDLVIQDDEDQVCVSFRTIRMVDPQFLATSPWQFKGVPPAELRKKIDSVGTPLARYILGEYILAEKEYNPLSVISRHDYEKILRKDPVVGTFVSPYILPDEIRRYNSPRFSRYIVRIPPGTTRALSGNVPDPQEWFRLHHHSLAVILMNNHSKYHPTGKDEGCWWEWSGPATPPLNGEHILLTRATGAVGGPEWMIIPPCGFYPGAGVLAIPCNDRALSGILNSHLAQFYILSSARKKGMTGYLLSHIMRFPVAIPDSEDSSANELFKKIACLVEKRCAFGKAGDEAVFVEEKTVIRKQVMECDEEINDLVYELYTLSPEEIQSIEDWLSRESPLTG